MNISTVSHLSRDTKHAAQEGADLAGLGTGVGLAHDAQLVVRGILSTLCLLEDLGIG